MGIVYLLHFDEPYYHARHYIGYTEDLPARLRTHRAGNGSPLIRAVVEAGINIQLARIWIQKDRHYERRLKDQHEAPHFCPICSNKYKRGFQNE